MDSVGQGVVVLDRDLHVRVWNTHATELWGVREDEAKGRAFLNLDIGIPLEELRDSLRRVLRADGGPQALVVASHNRRGRPFSCRVQLTPLQDGDSERNGVILTMEEWSGSGDGNREGDGAS